jgi:hypothetical protein
MNDFISMMGYREEAIKKIAFRLCDSSDQASVDTIFRECGLPFDDMTDYEKQKLEKELNKRQW